MPGMMRPIRVRGWWFSTKFVHQVSSIRGRAASVRPSTRPRGEVELDVVKMKSTATGHSRELSLNMENIKLQIIQNIFKFELSVLLSLLKQKQTIE